MAGTLVLQSFRSRGARRMGAAARLGWKPARRRPLVVTLGELVEAVSSVAGNGAEAAVVVSHLLRGARSVRRGPWGGP